MTGAEIRAARRMLDVTQAELAEMLKIHPMIVSRWERGAAKAPPYLRLAIAYLVTNPEGVS